MLHMIVDAAVLAALLLILLAIFVATGFGVAAWLRQRISQGEQIAEGDRAAVSMEESPIVDPPEFLLGDRREKQPFK